MFESFQQLLFISSA